MPRLWRLGVAVLLVPVSVAGAAPPLRVAVADAPPFAGRNVDGGWDGIAVDLWRAMGEALGLAWQLEERDQAEMLRGLQNGTLDVALGPLTITPEREEVVDFTHPYLSTTLAIAVRPESRPGWGRILGIVFAPRLVHVLVAMAAVGVTLGALVWLFEHRGNPGHFEGHMRRGLWSAIWWAAATLTTVGYGDKTPRTVPGRLVAILGMIAGILIVSVLTATFAGEIAAEHLRTRIRGAADLHHARVGTVAGSAAESWLERNDIRSDGYPSVAAALAALERRELDAVVYHDAALRYWTTVGPRRAVEVLPVTLAQEYYGFAFPPGSALLDRANVALLRVTHAESWERLVRSYLGAP